MKIIRIEQQSDGQSFCTLLDEDGQIMFDDSGPWGTREAALSAAVALAEDYDLTEADYWIEHVQGAPESDPVLKT